MSLISSTKDTMLNALTITQIGAHSAFPGGTGGSELSGGGYARVAATFSTSVSGIRSLSAAVNITVPAGSTVRWLSLWNGSTYLGYSPNAASPKEFFVNTSTDTLTVPAHGYVAGTKVTIYGDTTPSGITEGAVYYVVNPSTDSFQLASSAGGSPIDLTTAGGSACVVSTITEEVYAGGGTHTIGTWTIGLPN